MVVTLKLGEKTQKEIEQFYQDMKREKTPPYAVFQARCADNVITLYQSGKVVFQGVSADIDAELWKQRDKKLYPNNIQEVNKKEKKDKDKETEKRYDYDVIGSDEVGTGDFFGPIIVTSAFVSKKDVNFLRELGVIDSKKLEDEFILKIAPQIIKKIISESVILTNQEYNDTHNKDFNMNKIKAILHNKVIILITKKVKDYQHIVVDQFTTPRSYFSYLKNATKVQQKIVFLKQAEAKSLAVASASIISRYFFIKNMEKLSKQYQMKIPFGSSAYVDKFAVKFIRKYGIDELKKVAKLNFKNLEKIKELIKE